MNITNHEQFTNAFSEAMQQNSYISVDHGGHGYSCGEKTKNFKTRDITAKAQECFESFSNDSSSQPLSNRMMMLEKLESALGTFSYRIQHSIEKRWWYSILHFFGYQAKPPREVQSLLNLIHGKRAELQSQETSLQRPQEEVAHPLLKTLKASMLAKINSVVPIDQIQAVKILIDVGKYGEGRHIDLKACQDEIIKQTDSSSFTPDFLSQQINSILKKAEETLRLQDHHEVSYDYHVLVRDKNGAFSCAMNSSTSHFGSGGDKEITDVNEYFKLVSQRMNRPYHPPVDEQGNLG